MQAIEIRNRQDFESQLNEIMSKYQHRRLVFRGQVKDYPLIPSIRRGKGNTSSPGCIPWLTANWDVCARRLVSRFGKTEPYSIETQAVMQHYGYRSFFVDVTANPEIALWFALHEFKSEKTPLHVDSQLRSAVFQWAKYVPSPTGFMYLILVPEDESKKQYFDLTGIMPASATRIHRQRAGAIFCPSELRTIDNFVIAKLRIVDDGWFRNSNRNLRFTKLFPPPSVDVFYRSLCTTPYFIALETEMNQIELGHPLLGLFPIYAESIKELVKEYKPLTRILSHARLALQWNVATDVVDLENQRFKARSATRVLFSSLMIQTLSQEILVSDPLQTNGWPSRNLLLEFEPEASLVSPSPNALQEVVRGLWVIIGTKCIFVAEIIDTFDDVFVGHECIYSLPELNLISKQCKCSDHSYDSKLLRAASSLLTQGVIYLDKDDLGYLKLKYKSED